MFRNHRKKDDAVLLKRVITGNETWAYRNNKKFQLILFGSPRLNNNWRKGEGNDNFFAIYLLLIREFLIDAHSSIFSKYVFV